MRYLILSDLHSNLESLQEALEYKHYNRVVVLGDLVGYGANPNEVLHIVRSLTPDPIIRGNHDRIVAGLDDGEYFSPHAYQAAMWTRKAANKQNLIYLRNLAQGPVASGSLFTVSHGSPLDEDTYVIQEEEAWPQFGAFETPLCFFGHTHLPTIFALTREGGLSYEYPRNGQIYDLDLSGKLKYLINPGSVGQPRDNDPMGSFAVFDDGKAAIEFFRYPYPIAAAQKKILDAGLPPFLAHRLALGR